MTNLGLYGEPCAAGHTVYIFDRGGETRVAQVLAPYSVTWSRDRDDVSEATVLVTGSACSDQAAMLANIEPKRSEMVIFRGAERVWEGPVWRVGWHRNYVEIVAHDIFQYILETPLSQPYNNAYPYTGLATDRIAGILDFELDRWEVLDPPANIKPHIVIHHFPNEAETSASTLPFEMTVGEHLQSMARYGGIDFTCVGRSLHVWDVSRTIGETRVMTDADFADVVISAYGSDQVSKAYVVGNDGVYGYAEADDWSYYGPWTKIITAYNEEGSSEPTQTELNSQASRNVAGRIPVPVEVRVPDNSTIRLTDTLTIDKLVPGVKVPLLATLNARQMSQDQKLDHLTVTETPDGESVQVILVPASREDSNEEEE
jgi:hypothetical protein